MGEGRGRAGIAGQNPRQLPHQAQQPRGTSPHGTGWGSPKLTISLGKKHSGFQEATECPLVTALFSVLIFILLFLSQKLRPSAGTQTETKGQTHCRTHWQINTPLHWNKLRSFLRNKWPHWKFSFSQSSCSSLISYLTSSLKPRFSCSVCGVVPMWPLKSQHHLFTKPPVVRSPSCCSSKALEAGSHSTAGAAKAFLNHNLNF